jgi:hypothetical protein
VFENRVLRRIFGPKRGELTVEWRKLHNEELHNCTHHQISLSRSNHEELGGQDMWHVWERSVHGFGRKIQRKEPTQKTKAQMVGWDTN